jgi:type II secretory pathway predicted ATPase ExeA
MSAQYRIFFEMQCEPFAVEIKPEQILVTPALKALNERIHYAMNMGAVALVTGEIGSGKSTALRYVTEMLHPSQYRSLYLTATSGSIAELYRQLLHALGAPMRGVSKAIMVQNIRNELLELVQGQKLKVVWVIDEASLLRLEVFAELHTLTQLEKDSKPYLSSKPTMPSADFCQSIPAPYDAGSTGQIDRSRRVMRYHLHAYARRIYNHAFRTGIGL